MGPTSSSRFEITVNEGNPFDLSKDDTYYFPSGNVAANGDEREKSYMFKIYKWESTFTIDSFLRMTLHYDGSHISVISPPHVKGQQCGMCGDFNRDHRYEMLGPNECQLKNGNDMARHGLGIKRDRGNAQAQMKTVSTQRRTILSSKPDFMLTFNCTLPE